MNIRIQSFDSEQFGKEVVIFCVKRMNSYRGINLEAKDYFKRFYPSTKLLLQRILLLNKDVSNQELLILDLRRDIGLRV